MRIRPYIVWLSLVLAGCASRSPEADPPYYTVETIDLPEGLTAEAGGLDFLPDGRLVVCFHRGEVMIYDPETGGWDLFAHGLHDPLGIRAITDNEVLVMQRPELTRLVDEDGDGRADLYETVTDQFGISGNYHEFAYGPVIGPDGSMFIGLNAASSNAGVWDELRGEYNPLGHTAGMYSAVPYRGWILKVNADGRVEPWASGFRSPNGLGFDDEGNLFATDNQGDWVGTSKLYHVRKDQFYGHPSSLVWESDFDVDPTSLPVPVLEKMRTRAAVLFPQGDLADSPTEPVVDNTGGRFGPFTGQLFVGEMDHPRIMRVMLEEVDHTFQGAVVSFIDSTGLRLGNNRLAFGPDGSLWVGQTERKSGWIGSEGIQRIVWNGGTPMEVQSMNLTATGFDLTFTHPVDPDAAREPSAYQFARYYYAYHATYGSEQMDRRPVSVTNVELSSNRRKVSVSLSRLEPGYVYELEISGVKAAHGSPLAHNRLFYTLNRLKS